MTSQNPSAPPAVVPQPWLLDRQGWSTLLAGALLLLISYITNYGDDNLFQLSALPADDQIGMGLHLAALAALFGVDAVFSEGVVELATRLRHRAERTRQREANEAARERDRAAADREQAARRARIEARRRSLLRMSCLVAQCRFLLADTARNRLQLSEALAVLLEELRPPGGSSTAAGSA